jgi:type IV pilus assembly protein PilB
MLNVTGFARSLVTSGLIDEKTATDAYHVARLQKIPLISYLLDKKLIAPAQTATILSQDFGLPLLDIARINKSAIPYSLVSEKLIAAHQMLPLFKRNDNLFLGIFDPTQIEKMNEIRFHTGLNIVPILVEADKLKKAIDDLTAGKIELTSLSTQSVEAADVSKLTANVEIHDNIDELAVNDAPLVRFVDKAIIDAIGVKASDIHFEPYENVYRIRYRRDGMLYEVNKLPANLASRFAARLKIMSQLDISERRVPQDGRFKIRLSDHRSVGFRINTCPTLFGEKIVLRILDPNAANVSIDSLGFTREQRKIFEDAIKKPQGMILVTGPTGSGKTVTQYTALNILNRPDVNISTVEDPVEIYMMGINQVNVNRKTGLTFPNVLRAFLRQDPDVIMVGEIRDTETAEIAIKASQTGHLVLSTLHTNSAAETLTRLMSMGIAPFNIATSVVLVIAQRLVRRLCEHCKHSLDLPLEALLDAGFTAEEIPTLQIYGPTGCQQCIKGYKGQVGIFEVMPISPDIERMIMSNGNAFDINDVAQKQGVIGLRQAGLRKVKEGITSLEEINSAISYKI